MPGTLTTLHKTSTAPSLPMSPGESFRAALASERPLQVPGAINAYHAILAEKTGFRAIYLSGGGVAAGSLGVPDLGISNLDDVLTDVRRITDVCSLPLLVDVDTGFGASAFNIARTVKSLVKFGAAAMHIEDQVGAKRCGHRPNKELVSIGEMVDRIRAAVDARTDPSFVVMARTDALAVEGLEKAVERALACVAAGADMIFPEALTSEAEVERCAREIKGPLHYNRTGVSPRLTLERLNQLGIAIVSNATGALRASAVAMWDYMHEFARDDVALVNRFTEQHRKHPAGDLHAFVGFSEIKRLEEEFLPREEVAKKYAGAVGFQP